MLCVCVGLILAWQYTPPKAKQTKHNKAYHFMQQNKDIIIHGISTKLTAAACSGVSFRRFLFENVLLGPRRSISQEAWRVQYL